jgi:hypothetical protein
VNDFPKIGINTTDLIAEIERLISIAEKSDMGAVNWGDIGVAEIEYRLSMLTPDEGPYCAVIVEEASPGCRLEGWLNEQLDSQRFPHTTVSCEW